MFAPYKMPAELPDSAPLRPEDLADRRLGHFRQSAELARLPAKLKDSDVVLIGYPDDRGVERNFGRSGACEGPDEIRKNLYKMTPAARVKLEPQILDIGNLRSWSMNLLEAHEAARKTVGDLRKRGGRIVTLGGGHDWAYADFVDWDGPLIHLDAHLDMRPLPADDDRAGHSGTPFRRILSGGKSLTHVHVVGLQAHCNARAHLDWAGAFKVSTSFLEEMPSGLDDQWKFISQQIGLERIAGSVALSLDMDVFSQAVAPGVSAPQPLGLEPRLVMKLIRSLGPKLRQFGIYETNPRYDRDDATSRLAAKFIHEFMYGGV